MNFTVPSRPLAAAEILAIEPVGAVIVHAVENQANLLPAEVRRKAELAAEPPRLVFDPAAIASRQAPRRGSAPCRLGATPSEPRTARRPETSPSCRPRAARRAIQRDRTMPGPRPRRGQSDPRAARRTCSPTPPAAPSRRPAPSPRASSAATPAKIAIFTPLPTLPVLASLIVMHLDDFVRGLFTGRGRTSRLVRSRTGIPRSQGRSPSGPRTARPARPAIRPASAGQTTLTCRQGPRQPPAKDESPADRPRPLPIAGGLRLMSATLKHGELCCAKPAATENRGGWSPPIQTAGIG